jgi:hypothetical protein
VLALRRRVGLGSGAADRAADHRGNVRADPPDTRSPDRRQGRGSSAPGCRRREEMNTVQDAPDRLRLARLVELTRWGPELVQDALRGTVTELWALARLAPDIVDDAPSPRLRPGEVTPRLSPRPPGIRVARVARSARGTATGIAL